MNRVRYSPSMEQSQIFPSNERSQIFPSNEQSHICPCNEQSQKCPSREQSQIFPSNEQSAICPSNEKSRISSVESDMNRTEWIEPLYAILQLLGVDSTFASELKVKYFFLSLFCVCYIWVKINPTFQNWSRRIHWLRIGRRNSWRLLSMLPSVLAQEFTSMQVQRIHSLHHSLVLSWKS
jgi:hypothetical protein